MTQFNPLAGAVAGHPLAQRTLAAEKVRQARRAQALSKEMAAADDRLEHEVESAEAVHPTDPDGSASDPQPQPKRRPKRQSSAPDDGAVAPHIDLKA